MISFPDLTKRLITSSLAIAILFLMMIFLHTSIMHWIIVSLALLVTSVAFFEFSHFFHLERRKLLPYLLMGGGSLIVCTFFLQVVYSFSLFFVIATIFLVILLLVAYHFLNSNNATISLAYSVFSLFYIAVPIGMMLQILYFPVQSLSWGNGQLWFLFLIFVTKITDVGAYFGGRLLQGPKLAPKLSPGKTISGLIVGVASALVFSVLFSQVVGWASNWGLTPLRSLCLGGVLALMGQFGDLAESLMKRDVGVKDSNKIPGLGGILDMLDSLLFTTPIIYIFISLFC